VRIRAQATLEKARRRDVAPQSEKTTGMVGQGKVSKLKKAKRDGALAGDVEAVPDNREHLSFVHGPDCGMYWDQLSTSGREAEEWPS